MTVRGWIDDLVAGRRSLDDTVSLFRAHTWAAHPDEYDDDMTTDLPPVDANAWTAVSLDSRLTSEQYRTLARAYQESGTAPPLVASSEPIPASFWRSSDHPRSDKTGRFIEDEGVDFGRMPVAIIKALNAMPGAYEIGSPRGDVKSFPPLSSVGDARKIQDQMFKTAGREWTERERDGLEAYSYDTYPEINGTMRGNPAVATLGNARGATTIQGAMMPSPVSFTSFRGANGLGSLQVNSLKDLKKLIGTEVQDHGFLSTSYQESEAFIDTNRKFAIEIEVPEGTPLAFMEPVSRRPNEREVLLAAGLHYQIVDASQGPNGQYRLKVRVVPGKTVPVPIFAVEMLTASAAGDPMNVLANDRGLRRYWTRGAGAAKIGWGTDGSFNRCVLQLGKHVRNPQGLCAEYHKEATGEWPAEKGVESAVNVLVAHGTHNQDSHGNRAGDNDQSGSIGAQLDKINDRLEELRTKRRKSGKLSPAESEEFQELRNKRISIALSSSDVITVAAPKKRKVYADDEEWSGVLSVEGVESGDGRLFSLGSLDWAELPMPLMYQPANVGGHNASVIAGSIDKIARKGNEIVGWGKVFANMLNGEHGEGIENMLATGGVSVDVDKVKDADIEQVFAEGDDGGFTSVPEITIFNRGRIRGATLVAFPAFVEAKLALTGGTVTASATSSPRCGCDGDVLVAAGHTITIPDLPDPSWFSEPTDVKMDGALTITDNGRVFGFIAPSNTTHRSVKKRVPMGMRVDYSRWMNKETIVAGGGRVKTGVITMNCGHAATSNYGTLQNRKEHYDNSCSIFANVAVGEWPGKGVWFNGALRHGVTAEQVAAAQGCALSGDWQPHPDKPGVQEFIAALLVPVPGFPMARTKASVTFEDGLITASVVPVRFGEAEPRPQHEVAFDLLVATQAMIMENLGLDPDSEKARVMAEIEGIHV